MQERSHQAPSAPSEFIPPIAGSGLKRFQGGVEVPVSDRTWTRTLVAAFEGLDPKYQKEITGILSELGKEDPERAREIACQIADFFNGIGKTQDLGSFLDDIKQRAGRLKRNVN